MPEYVTIADRTEGLAYVNGTSGEAVIPCWEGKRRDPRLDCLALHDFIELCHRRGVIDDRKRQELHKTNIHTDPIRVLRLLIRPIESADA